MAYQILVINPGSTSTKLALFVDHDLKMEKTLRHDIEVIGQYKTIYEQKDFRKNLVLDFLKEQNIRLEDIDVFVGRGGVVRPVESGTFLVNEIMIADLVSAKYGNHASNLGGILAFELAKSVAKDAYIVDPVVVDELSSLARVSGLKGIERISIFHALNQKAVARKFAKDHGKRYEDLNLIVVHLGGGISVGWHKQGKVVDVNNALGGEGPFSPERSGTLPAFSLTDLCFSGKYTQDEIKRMLVSKGGLVSYLGTSSGIEIQKRIDSGDEEARFYFQAMAYQIVKQIGAIYFAAEGFIDDVIITGGLAYNTTLMGMINMMLDKILTPVIYPGEDEMTALASGALRVLKGEETVKQY
jgi:butyrate kinase